MDPRSVQQHNREALTSFRMQEPPQQICALSQELFLRRTNTLSGSDAKIAAMSRFKTVAPFTINTCGNKG